MAIPYGVAFSGWLAAAIFGGYIRFSLGSGGYLITGAALQFLAQVFRFWKPPFGLFAASFFLVALGQAFQDTQANSFVATVKGAHRWLGVIHGCYAVGGLVGPLIAAAIASTFAGQWAAFYVS
jgi:fucose permease